MTLATPNGWKLVAFVIASILFVLCLHLGTTRLRTGKKGSGIGFILAAVLLLGVMCGANPWG